MSWYNLSSSGTDTSIGGCSSLEYNEQEDKAYFLINIMGDGKYEKEKIQFTVRTLLTRVSTLEQDIPLTEIFNDPVMKEVEISGSGGGVRGRGDILYILCQEQASQADICNMTGLSKQTVNSSVQNMVRDGYLQQLSGEKNEKLKLTETGSAFVERTIAKLIHAENAVFSSWSEENRELFIALNRNYLEAFLEELRKM